VNRTHAGPGHVTIKFIDQGWKVWAEFDGGVGANLNLRNGTYFGGIPRDDPFANFGAEFGLGNILDRGLTYSPLQIAEAVIFWGGIIVGICRIWISARSQRGHIPKLNP
jgi:hypothetical protein